MLKSRTGGKSIGNGWKGRKWRAVRRVASNVGGRGDSVGVNYLVRKRGRGTHFPSRRRRI